VLLSLTITRNASGYASLDGLQVKFVRDPLKDRMDDDTGWTTVKNVDDIQLKAEEIVVSFNRISKEEAESLMEDMAAEVARAREVKKESREKKAKARKERKDAK